MNIKINRNTATLLVAALAIVVALVVLPDLITRLLLSLTNIAWIIFLLSATVWIWRHMDDK